MSAPGPTFQELADVMAAVTEQRPLPDFAAEHEPAPSRPDRSAYDEYLRTGRYPINPLVSIHAARLVERCRQYLAVQSAMGDAR